MAFVNFCLDATLLVAVLVLGWISAMLQVVFPAPTAADGWILWGLTFNEWRDLQFSAMCVCALMILVHVMFHWNWVCGIITTKVLRRKTRPDEGMQTIYGVGTMIVLLVLTGGGIVAALLTVVRPPH